MNMSFIRTLLFVSTWLVGAARPIDVRVIGGWLRGSWHEKRGVGRWLGVPYAKPPIGELRWMPPVDKEGWEGVRGATLFPPDCPQEPDYTSFFPGNQNEDCLYLNVWAPLINGSVSKDQLLPVMVFIHGGSFTAGSGSGNDWPTSPLYQGSYISPSGAVLVTYNYRLGVFGFLGGSEVSRVTPDGSHGNFGLQDSLLVLRWVKANIVTFGGDPERVTIFGESSGASMVATFMVANASRGLFINAGLESGSFDNATVQLHPNEVYLQLLDDAGCWNISCLRNKTYNEILRAAAPATKSGLWGPVVDNVILSKPPERSAANGEFHKEMKSVLLGTNENEGRLLINEKWPYIRTKDQYLEWVVGCGYFPASAAHEIIARYPCRGGDLGCWEAASSVFTDSQFACPARRTARGLAKGGWLNVFMYYLGFSPPAYSRFLAIASGIDPKIVGVPHGGELPFVFNDTTWLTTPAGRRIATQFMTYYHNIAAHSDASYGLPTPVVPVWPAYSPESDLTLYVGNHTMPSPHIKKIYCDFWDNVELPMTPQA